MLEVGIFILGMIVGVFLGILFAGLSVAASKNNSSERG